MKFFFLFFLGLLLSLLARSRQYSLINYHAINDTISFSHDPQGIYFKISYPYFYTIECMPSDSGNILTVMTSNVENGKTIKSDTISGLPKFFRIQDIAVNQKYLLITGNGRYLYYEFGKIETTLNSLMIPSKSDSINFRSCEFINDSMALLYTIYNYHPCDGNAGLHMKILDLNSNKFVSSRFYTFPSIALSHLNVNWVTVSQDKIIVMTPLSSVKYTFNFNLDLLKTDTIHGIFSNKELADNFHFQDTVDNVINTEITRIRNLQKQKNEKANSEICQSDIYGKTFIFETIKKTRSNYAFIETVFNINPTTVGIVVSRPQYNDLYRDLYFYNPNSNTIVKKYEKWPCHSMDTLTTKEDFYVINIGAGKLRLPYFYNGKIYSSTLLDPALYFNGNLKKVNEDIYHKIMKTGYLPTILEYKLN